MNNESMNNEWDNSTPADPGSAPADFNAARRRKATLTDPTKGDRLPPHSTEGEQGVLGCVMLSPMDCLPKVRKRFKAAEGEEFYDLRHREIWLTLCRMYDDWTAGKPVCSRESAAGGIDLITLQQRLKDYQKLEMVGGLAYLAALPDAVPSAANLDYYVEIVAEKFVVRQFIGFCSEAVGRLYDWPGQVDHLLDELQRDFTVLARHASPPEEAGRMYLKPSDMGDEFFQRWFGKTKGVHGLPLPDKAFGDFPFLIRTRELTLVEAETNMGKSTLASYIVLHLLRHGMKAVIDSREVHYVDTMKKLVMQLTGIGEAQLCLVGNEQAKAHGYVECPCVVCGAAVGTWNKAMRWLEKRVVVNKTTGIKHWRDILDAFHELAGHGYNLFVLDSLMRIGIADDDFTQQAECVSAFSNFCIETDSHQFLINHRNKGDGDYRQKSGGSYKVAANAHNICSVWKNEKKFEELSPWVDKLRDKAHAYSYQEFLSDAAKTLAKPDAKFYVHKQRLDGTRSNAARELWFLKRSGQYFDHRHERPEQSINWLARWTKHDHEAKAAAVAPVVGHDVCEHWPEGKEPTTES